MLWDPTHVANHWRALTPAASHVLPLALRFPPFRHATFSVYAAFTGDDYYSGAIKSQFGVGRAQRAFEGSWYKANSRLY